MTKQLCWCASSFMARQLCASGCAFLSQGWVRGRFLISTGGSEGPRGQKAAVEVRWGLSPICDMGWMEIGGIRGGTGLVLVLPSACEWRGDWGWRRNGPCCKLGRKKKWKCEVEFQSQCKKEELKEERKYIFSKWGSSSKAKPLFSIVSRLKAQVWLQKAVRDLWMTVFAGL